MKLFQHHNRKAKHFFKWAGLLFILSQSSLVTAAPTSSDFALVPPLISDSAAPNVMLVLSNDHELYKKAYSDYSDLDGDGLLEESYKDSFTYTGYFDSDFCYDYTTSGVHRFIPVDDISANTNHRCDGVSSKWSGNFLNWSTMTRMDIVRTVLYGGLRIRASDSATVGGTAGKTILERSFIPDDAHAYVKVFEGNTQWYTPWTKSAISMCNVTYQDDSENPLIRVAFGDWSYWTASEQEQCHYTNENDRVLGIQPGTGLSNRPSPHDYSVKVSVCEAGVDSSSSRCKAYAHSGTGDVTYKPVGLLQQYGDNGTINFGLMTGSYNKKASGGVLRKDILPLAGNATASQNEIKLDTGQFINQTDGDAGVINTLNRLKIVGWSFSDSVYDSVEPDTHNGNIYSDCAHWGIDKNTFLNSTNKLRRCSNWGNPLSEIYLEALRYFAGVNPTTAFNTSDSSYIDLGQLSWNDPLDSSNFCASCSIIVLSTGLNSFDTDELGTVTDIQDDSGYLDATKLDALVDSIGSIENIIGGSYLVGSHGSDNDEICTAKDITNLSDVKGLCPEVPNLEGGFDIAGLSYHALITDLRSDFEGVQNVNTFSVALAESLPNFELDVNGNTVNFVPTCQSHTDSNRKLDQDGWSNCSFLDVRLESQNIYGGSMVITWEDSLWGSDFDMDAVSRLEFCIGDDAKLCPDTPDYSGLEHGYSESDFAWKDGLGDDSVQFRMSAVLTAAGYAIRFGYTISGVESGVETNLITNPEDNVMNAYPRTIDGNYVTRGVLGNGNQSFLLVEGNYAIRRLTGNGGSKSIIYHEPATYKATATVTAGKMLENPLWYTAKYGSYNDIDGDGTPLYNNDPDDHREWDTKDTTGNDGADGIPDNYFPVRDPTELITSLSQVFESISERISSGTAAAVVANSSTGLGAVYQAYYHPNYTDSTDTSIVWGGVLHAMFIDESGRFREDNGTSAALDDTDTDRVVNIYFDESVTPNRTRFQRYLQTGTGSASILTATGTPQDLENFSSIWNARDVLADITQANIVTQRTLSGTTGNFTQNSGTYRYIFTYLDDHLGSGTVGTVDSGEVVDFVADNFNPSSYTNHRYLALPDSADAMNLVSYIRGQDVSGWRSRLVDIPGDNTTTQKYWVLGDIVHSSPLVVNPPNQRYDINFGDEAYDTFKQQYARRRQMVYAGGNDGMLHAFNGGVWDSAGKAFHTQNYDSGSGLYEAGQEHKLGAEMWAYIPMNLLPHLQWLKETEYPHVYYMDAAPKSYDVNIFAHDATHPGGWGTILVVGMRLGGSDFNVDLDGDMVDDTLMSSAIIVMDITDPEKPPTLLAEISDPDLGFTTSTPALIRARVPTEAGSFATPVANRWLLVFGSGPDTLTTATSTGQDAKVYAYDLVDNELVTIATQAQTPASDPSGYFGDFLSVDWDNDLVDDVIYVGTVEGSESAPTGRMKRIALSQSTDMGLSSGLAAMSDVLNVGQPISARASTQIDVGQNEQWLFFGTGRLFTSVDNRSETQQSFYGIKEPANHDTSSVSVSSLLNSTNIIVENDGAVSDTVVDDQLTVDSTNLDTFDEVYRFMGNKPGWVRNLSYGGANPSERIFSASLAIGSSVVFSAYKPSYDLCTIEGDGYLYALNFRTGTAEVFGPFGSEDGIAFAGVELGQGAPSAPTAIVRTGNDAIPGGEGSVNNADVSVVTGSTTGVTTSTGFVSAPGTGARMSWEELSIPF